MTPTPFAHLVCPGFLPDYPICEFIEIGDDLGQLSITLAHGAQAFNAPWLVLPVTGFGREGAPLLLRFERVATTRQGAMFVLRAAVGGEG
jgi:hypothetical protein